MFLLLHQLQQVVIYKFNFGTKTFFISLVKDDVTVVKMWTYERFVDN